jgi:hypothetical protein
VFILQRHFLHVHYVRRFYTLCAFVVSVSTCNAKDISPQLPLRSVGNKKGLDETMNTGVTMQTERFPFITD